MLAGPLFAVFQANTLTVTCLGKMFLKKLHSIRDAREAVQKGRSPHRAISYLLALAPIHVAAKVVCVVCVRY